MTLSTRGVDSQVVCRPNNDCPGYVESQRSEQEKSFAPGVVLFSPLVEIPDFRKLGCPCYEKPIVPQVNGFSVTAPTEFALVQHAQFISSADGSYFIRNLFLVTDRRGIPDLCQSMQASIDERIQAALAECDLHHQKQLEPAGIPLHDTRTQSHVRFVAKEHLCGSC